jgi:VanZ family protein
MAVIAWLSSDQWSAEHTHPVVRSLVQWLLPWATVGQVDVVHAIVRKCAHVTEYAILAALWFRMFVRDHRWPEARSGWTAVIISVAWAALDEVHQIFVPTRGASVIDVIIDATGAVAAVWLLGWIGRSDQREGATPDR